MRRSRWTWLVAYGVAVAVAVAGTLVYLHHRSSTSEPAAHRAARPLPALVDTAFPVSMDVFPARHSIAQGQWLYIGIQSTAATNLELWDGSRRFLSQAPVAHGNGISVRWPALTIGPHLLYARGIDAHHQSASSLVYSLDVLDPNISVHGKSPALEVPVGPRESAGAAAARLGVPSAEVSLSPPAHASTGPSRTVIVRMPPQPGSALGGSAVTVLPTSSTSASGPQISVTTSKCDVTAHVSHVSGATTLAEAQAGRPGFVVAGTRTRDGELTLKNLMPGTHLITAEDGAGRATPVQYTVPQSCAKSAGWTGNITLIGDVLTLPAPLVHGYIYVGVGNQAFQRIPANPNEFLVSPARRVDLDGAMPELDGSSLTVQAWQQSGLTARTVGQGVFVPPLGTPLSSTVGEPDAVTMSGIDDQGKFQASSLTLALDRKVTFNWAADSTRVNAVQWQVLTQPLSDADTDLNPVGLLATGLSERYRGIQIGGPAVTGTFVIDTHDLAPQKSGLLKFAPRVTQTVYIRAVPVFTAPPIRTQTAPSPPTVVGNSSNPLLINLPAIPSPAPGAFNITSATVDLGRVPNPDLLDCADVTVHWASPPPWRVGDPVWEASYPTSKVYCYSDFGHPSGQCDDFFCDLEEGISTIVDGLSDLWNLIASAYNTLVTLAVTEFAKLNPICLTIEGIDVAGKAANAPGSSLADKAKGLCGQIATNVGRAGISAVLTSFGIPPVLPTSAQLKAIAKGDLTQLGVEVLTELGVPCDSVTLDPDQASSVNTAAGAAGVTVPTQPDGSISICAVAVQAVLSKIEAQVKTQAQDVAASYASIPPCPIDECTIVPTPGGRLQPITVAIAAQRTAGDSLAGENVPVNVAFIGSPVPPLFRDGNGLLTTTAEQPDTAQAVLTFSTPTMGTSEPGTEFATEVDNSSLYDLHAGDTVTANISGDPGQSQLSGFFMTVGHYQAQQTR